MEPDTITAPAGDGAVAPAEAERTSLSLEQAAGLLAERESKEDPSPAEPKAEPQEQQTGAEAPDTPPEEQVEETTKPAEEAEPEGQSEPEKYVHGNAKTRLRDGTVVDVSDLKKAYDELKEYRVKTPQLSAAEQQLRSRSAQIAQQQQFLQAALPFALKWAQQAVPPPPDPDLINPNSPKYDPIAHYEQDKAHQNGRLQVQQLQSAEAAQKHQTSQQQQAQFTAYVSEEQKKLFDKIPTMKESPARRKEIQDRFVETAAKYGFSRDEVENVYDHRLLHMVHELDARASAYDKLMAEQAKKKEVVKAKETAAVPVRPPQRRVSAGETKGEQKQELMSRVRATGGDMREVAAAIQKLGL